MIVIAVLLLPALGLLLLVMDRFEDWLPVTSFSPRHARVRRHLRLIPGEASNSPSQSADGAAEHEAA
ncbi:hypothetical protein [Streptomyces broussonetiae]|uniref:Uncharacterized protein n=1 Tax=Streptomyces broussonetiae TaxID=2686304 RepID=A0A6I6MPN5_9ACTN|nr:hypothetical protein [Streptomyces broussonetiae]QHA02193.1 hypothetical protein GQF42_01530 [Streptomyces broussonetiae]